jgi:hypothetical protein
MAQQQYAVTGQNLGMHGVDSRLWLKISTIVNVVVSGLVTLSMGPWLLILPMWLIADPLSALPVVDAPILILLYILYRRRPKVIWGMLVYGLLRVEEFVRATLLNTPDREMKLALSAFCGMYLGAVLGEALKAPAWLRGILFFSGALLPAALIIGLDTLI